LAYPGFSFGHKKIIPATIENVIQDLANQYNVPVFRKTSCLVSYVHGLERDYNAHYYRPNEVGCFSCSMKDKCFAFKTSLIAVNYSILPFNHSVVNKTKHECWLKKKGICEFPTEDCSNINDCVIQTKEQLTTADVRCIKWLTGMTVDSDFYESPYLSDFWRVR